MKSSRKLIVGKLREAEESNRRKSRIITQFEREQKESKVRIEIDVKIAADDARNAKFPLRRSAGATHRQRPAAGPRPPLAPSRG